MLKYVSDNAKEFRGTYGNVSSASIGAIQRQLLQLEQDGADVFFGEPELNLDDWLQTEGSQGVINILQVRTLDACASHIQRVFTVVVGSSCLSNCLKSAICHNQNL